MWIVIFFDLPVKTPVERKIAAKFRKFLLNDGYIMLQWSVYSRVCNGLDSTNTHVSRIKEELPKNGNIRLLQITDAQYSRIQLLVGSKKTKEEKKDAAYQLNLF